MFGWLGDLVLQDSRMNDVRVSHITCITTTPTFHTAAAAAAAIALCTYP